MPNVASLSKSSLSIVSLCMDLSIAFLAILPTSHPIFPANATANVGISIVKPLLRIPITPVPIVPAIPPAKPPNMPAITPFLLKSEAISESMPAPEDFFRLNNPFLVTAFSILVTFLIKAFLNLSFSLFSLISRFSSFLSLTLSRIFDAIESVFPSSELFSLSLIIDDELISEILEFKSLIVDSSIDFFCSRLSLYD